MAGAGDTVVVRAGSYAGFQLGWDFPHSGMAGAPITFKADPGAVIEGRNGKTADGINPEGSSHVVIEGFTVNNASGNITRDCIRTVNGDYVVVRNNSVSNCNNVGIATSHSDHVRIEGNTTGFNNTGTGDHHGIYVANATVNPAVVGNTIRGNWGNGLHMNGDLSMAPTLFADAAANDYHLSATSPAIDAGASLDASAADIEGNARPSGAGYDVGAYEFGGTSAPPPVADVEPPVIPSAQVSVARRSATVTWTTDETSTTVVRYGKTTTYGKTKASATGVRHSVTLTKPSAHTLHHYRVESEAASGNKATSTDLTFRTVR